MRNRRAARPILLVVDDDPDSVKVIRRCAGTVGYEVVTCDRGAAALAAHASRPAEVAMIDAGMRDVNASTSCARYDAPRPDPR